MIVEYMYDGGYEWNNRTPNWYTLETLAYECCNWGQESIPITIKRINRRVK